MKAKKILLWIICLVVIVVAGVFYAYVKRDVALYDTNYSGTTMVYDTHVFKGHDGELTFSCDKDNLCGIKLFLQVSAKAGNTRLKYTVYEGTDEVSSGSIKISKFKNGKLTELGFDRIKESSGKTYTVRFSAPVTEDGNVLIGSAPNSGIAMKYTYVVWDIQTMIIFILFMAYLVGFMKLLSSMFRK